MEAYPSGPAPRIPAAIVLDDGGAELAVRKP
jgi:hypothetical protein